MPEERYEIDGFSISAARHTSRASAEKSVREQLKRLASGVDPFEEDPGLFNETDPVAFAERVLVDTSTLEPLKLWPHQAEDLRCTSARIIHQDGREVGKTVDIIVDMLHKGFTTKNKEFLLATPLRLHYNTILIEIEKQRMASPALRKRIKRMATDDGYPYLLFPQGTIIHLRSGHPTGDAFRSLHVDGIWVDEAALLSPAAWKALRHCLKKGFWRVYSTPDGQRTTPYYQYTKAKSWTLFKWPSWIAPTWDEQKAREMEEDCGGRNTLAWQHEVSGEHGEPTMAAFDLVAVQAAMVDVDGYTLRRLSGADFKDLHQAQEGQDRILQRLTSLLGLPERRGVFHLGGDLGYSKDPAELVVDEQTPDGTLTKAQRH